MNASSLICFGALAIVGASFLRAAEPFVRSITAQGVAVQEYAPDRADLTVEIKVISDALETSREAVDAAHKELVAVLKKAGVPEKDVGLKLRTMKRETDWEEGKRVFRGYSCAERIEVVVRRLENLTAVTEAMAGIEHLELEDMDFRSTKEGEARREALVKAADAVRQKAEALAKNAGVKITMLLELREDASGYYVENLAGNYSGPADSEAGVATRTVRVTVTARYAIE